jgi:hypothetical protein
MSRQAFHSTCANPNTQRRAPLFYRFLRFVTLCFNWSPRRSACGVAIAASVSGVRARFQHTSDARIAASMRSGGAMRSQRSASTHAAARARPAAYFEMVSSAMPFVRGPINPIAAITIAIAPAMNANTPSVPKPFSTAAMTNDEKIAEKRLHE